MANLKRNFIYNSILTLSGYVFPLLTFPYISRVLGANNVGIVNLVLSIVDYYILFSTLGLSIVGLREIARCKDRNQINLVFSQLVSLHIILTAIVFAIYCISIICIPTFEKYSPLYWIGGLKIIFNVFLIEWFFQGLQDFKYITYRSLFVKTLYVIAILTFVRTRNDYTIYFAITIAQIVINSIINWQYSKKLVTYRFSINGLKYYIKPLISWGINIILLSFYTTFNVMYLGFVAGPLYVGYYTTATKIYTIILSLLQAYNGVFIPYLSSLQSQGNIAEFKNTINKSFTIVSSLSIPLVVLCYCLAPEIIDVIAGKEFLPAIYSFRIMVFQILIIGISQITNSQILLSLKKDKEILISTLIGSIICITIIALFAEKYKDIAASYAVTISHIVEFFFLLYYAKRSLDFRFPIKDFIFWALLTVPMIFICRYIKNNIETSIMTCVIATLLSLIYYLPIIYYIKKKEFVNHLHKNPHNE